jgi:4-carboxymuconolactone decarboxylase
MRAGIATGFNAFQTVLDDGSMIGPWNTSLHHPGVGKASWELTKAVNAMGALPANAKEIERRISTLMAASGAKWTFAKLATS